MQSRYKITGVFVLMGLFGGSMYYAGQQEGMALVEQAKVEVAPAKAVVAPKKAKEPKTVSLETHKPPGPSYTFFEVLDDPAMKSYVDLEGKVVQASFKPSVKQAPEKTSRNTVPQVLKAKAPSSPQISAPVKKPKPVSTSISASKTIAALSAVAALSNEPDHWVQVASFKEEERAKALESELRKKGFPSFVKGRSVPDKGTWYRVYLGSYATRNDAEQAAGKMAKDSRWKPMIVRPN